MLRSEVLGFLILILIRLNFSLAILQLDRKNQVGYKLSA